MTQTKTAPKSLVLVIGAGASTEVQLPTGKKLKDQIARALDIRYENGHHQNSGDNIIASALKEIFKENTQQNPSFNNALHSCWRIRDAMPQAISIDNFIDAHRKDETIAICGKLGIARCILEAESNSKIHFKNDNIDSRLRFNSTEATWYNSFFQILTENCQQEEIADRFKMISIITFNYDRCIEHYLHQALQNYYGMNAIDAAEAISKLEIHHPYGRIGALPWMDRTTGIEFGSKPSPLKLVDLAAQLRTFTEGTNPDTSDVLEIRNALASARRIAFLGFAFHRLNLELLFPGLPINQSFKKRPIFATAIGISKSDVEAIKANLSTLGKIHIELMHFERELTCAQLFAEHWRGLSLI